MHWGLTDTTFLKPFLVRVESVLLRGHSLVLPNHSAAPIYSVQTKVRTRAKAIKFIFQEPQRNVEMIAKLRETRHSTFYVMLLDQLTWNSSDRKCESAQRYVSADTALLPVTALTSTTRVVLSEEETHRALHCCTTIQMIHKHKGAALIQRKCLLVGVAWAAAGVATTLGSANTAR